MQEAALAVASFAHGRTMQTLRSDDILRSAIYYKFVIIGEALSKLRQRDQATAESISEHARIVGFRNQIIHGYGMVDHETTWRIIEIKIPILIRELGDLLNSRRSGDK